ncbi:hypothetical protein [Stackebrandtia nassauensis]|uniref:Uncharacterized protein n=1 Tax=Stackebrandtia nassauensis (strain DSM 44728 / CIP 108903 / NRRL B-16338 / NBRC 102104 / LLR-40K-21) TaxID=446470 RepID=D3PXS9_STANL|nr:hypothetical protein [Stackebrandtia nassauensis]ADD43409.1 hypothetical protein Snas_3752 [Stackebrandtia nassauensis DSM 44728]
MVAPIRRANPYNELKRHLKVDHTPGAPSPPMLSMRAPSGSGKTTCLRELHRELDATAPRAYMDCASLTSDDIPLLLEKTKFFMTQRCPPAGALRFNRLEVGLVAMAASIDFTVHRVAMRQLREHIRTSLRTDPGWLTRLLSAATTDALGNALPVPLVATSEELVGSLSVFGAYLRSKSQGILRAIRWYGQALDGPARPPFATLAQLHQWSADPEERRYRDDLLVDAFLADLRENYAPGAYRAPLPYRCPLFLDNASTGIGPEFLEVLADRREAAHVGGLTADPLLILAASQDDIPGVDTTPISLDPFSESEIRKVAASTRHNLDRRAHLLVHQLTGGYPYAAVAVVNVMRRESVDVARGLGPLLSAPSGSKDGGELTVEEHLLESLTQSLLSDTRGTPVLGGVVEPLYTYAAARTAADAAWLCERFPHDGRVNSSLLPSLPLWEDADLGAGHRMLRWLLSRRLREREGEPDWNTVYTRLAEHARDNGATADALYYALATGDLAHVSRVLTDRLDDTSEDFSWFDLLYHVTAAPCLTVDVAAEQPHVTQIRLAADLSSREPEHLVRVARVVAGEWIAGHRCTRPDRELLHYQIDDDLGHLLAFPAVAKDVARHRARQRTQRRKWR